jgi:hypothetical protein
MYVWQKNTHADLPQCKPTHHSTNGHGAGDNFADGGTITPSGIVRESGAALQRTALAMASEVAHFVTNPDSLSVR